MGSVSPFVKVTIPANAHRPGPQYIPVSLIRSVNKRELMLTDRVENAVAATNLGQGSPLPAWKLSIEESADVVAERIQRALTATNSPPERDLG